MAAVTEGPMQPLPDEVDGVFVGGGHNALVAAAYLARAGLDVLVLEAGPRLGGGVTTEECTLPSFRHNLHAFFVRWTPDYRLWHDLQLDRFGVRTIHPEVQNGLPYDGGERALVTHRDLGRSLEAIAEVSAADARAYERRHAEYGVLTERIVTPLRFAPPLPPDEERDLLRRSRLGRRYLDLAARSALEIVLDDFRSEPLRALVAFNVAVRGYLPVLDVPGTGYCTVLALPNSHQGRMIAGGSAEMTRALAAAVHAAGGRLATSSPVASIDVAHGRVRAVTTEDGRQVRARRFVASSVPAPITLLDLVDATHLDPGLVADLRGYRWLEEALFGAHLALARRPRFTAEGRCPELPRALNLILGYETSDDIIADMAAIRARTMPGVPGLHASVPTVNDPTQAPAGRHTSFGWQFVPSELRDCPEGGRDVWDERASSAHVETMVRSYARYAPDLPDCLLAVEAHSPADTAALVPSMPRGDRHHGSYHPDNWGANRPHPALAGYRTPVDGLYLCGSSQHPGGSFTGTPGFNAAGVIADDLGVAPWWERPDVRKALAALD